VIIDVLLVGSVTVAELSRVDALSNVLVFLAHDVARRAIRSKLVFIV
jgi:hypothetical protein